MFSSACPQYITSPPEDLFILDKIIKGEAKDKGKLVETIQKAAIKALPATGQHPGHAIGFFEQGILLGGALFLSVVIPALGYASWVGGSSAWGFVGNLRAGRG